MKKLTELARVIRSKNASPFELTLDIIFKNDSDYFTIKERELINKSLIAGIYNIEEENIRKLVYFDPALAIKVCVKRACPSGAPGDTDVYGAQQHAPLLGLSLDL
mgnify:CR=1 FL=1